MTQKTNVIFKPRRLIGINTQMSDYSDFACDQMLSRLENPSPPVMSAAVNGYDTVRVSWTEPTSCADGTILSQEVIAGYNIYIKSGSAPTTSSYDTKERLLSLFYIHQPGTSNTYYYGVTCVDTTGRESVLSNTVSGKVTGYVTGNDDPVSLADSLYISQEYIGYYDPSYNSGAGAWIAYIRNNGDFFLRGADTEEYFQWEYSTSTLIVAGTYKSSVGLQKIEIDNSGSLAHSVVAYDSSGEERTIISDDGLEIYNTSGYGSTTNRVLYLPNAIGTDAIFKYTNVLFGDTVIIGTTTDPSTSDKLYVSGAANITGVLVVGDHGTASNAQVVNVCYGTGSPPTASDTPIGTLFVKYTA